LVVENRGFAALFAEKLCFSVRYHDERAAMPPLKGRNLRRSTVDSFQIEGKAAETVVEYLKSFANFKTLPFLTTCNLLRSRKCARFDIGGKSRLVFGT
jgi:hypothetical protein